MHPWHGIPLFSISNCILWSQTKCSRISQAVIPSWNANLPGHFFKSYLIHLPLSFTPHLCHCFHFGSTTHMVLAQCCILLYPPQLEIGKNSKHSKSSIQGCFSPVWKDNDEITLVCHEELQGILPWFDFCFFFSPNWLLHCPLWFLNLPNLFRRDAVSKHMIPDGVCFSSARI